MGTLWQGVCDHLYSLIVSTSEYSQLVERAVVGLLRLAIRLLRKDDIATQVGFSKPANIAQPKINMFLVNAYEGRDTMFAGIYQVNPLFEKGQQAKLKLSGISANASHLKGSYNLY